MIKQQKVTNPLIRYFPHISYFIILSEDFLRSRKEIENYMIKHNICGERLVTDILEAMTSQGHLVRKKLKGKKRMGYTINEEIISDFNESYTTTGFTKKGLPIYDKMTQKELYQEINGFIRRYKKAITDKKSLINESLESFFILHTMFLTVCLSWICRLNLSIYGGVFHNAQHKILLAHTNIQTLGGFIELLLRKMQEKNTDGYDMFLTSMNHYFEFLDPFEGTPYSKTSKEASSLID